VALTAGALKEEEQRAMEVHGRFYSKPIEREKLEGFLEKYIGRASKEYEDKRETKRRSF